MPAQMPSSSWIVCGTDSRHRPGLADRRGGTSGEVGGDVARSHTVPEFCGIGNRAIPRRSKVFGRAYAGEFAPLGRHPVVAVTG